MLWDDRLAEVWAEPRRAGAGVVVGAAAVLTARHVVAGALDGGRVLARVVRPGAATAGWVPMRVLAEDADWDVALLGVSDEKAAAGGSGARWLAPSSPSPVFVRLGTAAEHDCELAGFPQAEVQRAPDGSPVGTVRQSEQVTGTLLPAGQGQAPVNPERLMPRRWMPFDTEGSTPGTQAGWGGMSGAGVVLADGRLAGLVTTAEAGHQQRRLYVVPFADVLAQSGKIARALAAVLAGPAVVEVRAAPLYRDVLQDGCLGPDGVPVLVREAGLKAFGVKPAGVPGEPDFLDYVPRDTDHELRDGLQAAQADHRMLLVVGGSAGGKSRSAAEAARLLLPGHRLLCPRQTSLGRLRELPLADLGPALVWLDDAERYEERAFGDTIGRLLRAGVTVVATIRRSELQARKPKGDLRNPFGEALADRELVMEVAWPVNWNDQERQRVGDHVNYPPLLHWVATGRSPSAWVVAGPALQDRLRDAEADDEWPARSALVRAVLDWYRTGIGQPVPLATAADLLQAYLPDGAEAAEIDDAEIEDALAWGLESVVGAARTTSQSLLAKTATDAVTVHDYIQDADTRTTPGPVAEAVWVAALADAASDDARFGIGVAAAVQDNTAIAAEGWLPLASKGHTDAMFNLGVVLSEGNPSQARQWYERAAEAGNSDAMNNLGLLLEHNDPARARQWYRRAAQAGNTNARFNLGRVTDSDQDQLRIRDVPGGPSESRRVEVTWRGEGAPPQEAKTVFAVPGDAGGGERVRWYLEDYPEFPAAPAPAIAAEAEAELAHDGADLFAGVFASADAAEIWERARDRLGEVRVEVDTVGDGPGLAWELLRDPATGAPVALGAGAFVRTHLPAAGQPVLPEPAGDRLRVLLVIARPGGRDDVPFRSVASRLVRGGAEQMEGLDLDVLRPATFARLSEVLHTALEAGRPYHVVHFDGHGTWLDLTGPGTEPDSANTDAEGDAAVALPPPMSEVSVEAPVRAGPHGYLLFEDPGNEENQQLADGPTLGGLLAATGVPVLVLNACRSAYTEALDRPADPPREAPGTAAGGDGTGIGDGGPAGDGQARIQAYGSLAAEVADAGVPGVVAMRYNVYVVTAAQFIADLYAHLLAGRSLGGAATAARQALAAEPVRQIGAVPVVLQDWVVPVVYEAAPLVLLRPPQRAAPLIKLTTTEARPEGGGAVDAGGVPGPPDAGFFGRDESLLALDRAFDTHPVLLLHAFAGAGKSSTAAEFARWYEATGGLDHPDHPEWGPGPVLWSSFEHHLTADQVIATAGDLFAGVLEANGIQWAAVTDPAQRRDIVLHVLVQVPVLWVWDNVEPVTGFPEGTQSDWTQAEQDGLLELLRDLAQHSRCKVLVTSRRDEHHWLGDLPTRVQLPPMPMRESLQLAGALAARHGRSLGTADWRPLLRYAAGNPLTITVVVGQAARSSLATTEGIEGFVAALEAGGAQLEAGDDTALGRTRSLAASLSYGFTEAFTEAERTQLAVLHLFRDTADADALRYMGDQEMLGEDAVPELAGMDRDAVIGLLDRAAGIGLLESLGLGSEYYRIHPALPWYFSSLFTASYGLPDSPPAARAARAYAQALGALGDHYHRQAEGGHAVRVVPVLEAEEVNLRHALTLARTGELWDAATGCLQGLRVLYLRTGRDGEWARLVAAVSPDFIDSATGGPLPGRDEYWDLVNEYRVRLARLARDWPAAAALQTARTAWNRDLAAAALATPPASLTPLQRGRIRSLALNLEELGQILRYQADPGCLPYYQEALGLYKRIGGRHEEAELAINLGNAYMEVPGLRDLDQAEYWCGHSLRLRTDSDHLGRAKSLSQLGVIALYRFDDAKAAAAAASVLLEHLNAALRYCLQARELDPPDDHESRAADENQLGAIYAKAGDTEQALRHFQQSLWHQEARGYIYGAGQGRYNIAVLLAGAGRVSDALLYARAALHNYQQAGPGAAADAAEVERLIARWEQSNH
jgi:tetratricopeptide (TPR) repeat protein